MFLTYLTPLGQKGNILINILHNFLINYKTSGNYKNRIGGSWVTLEPEPKRMKCETICFSSIYQVNTELPSSLPILFGHIQNIKLLAWYSGNNRFKSPKMFGSGLVSAMYEIYGIKYL